MANQSLKQELVDKLNQMSEDELLQIYLKSQNTIILPETIANLMSRVAQLEFNFQSLKLAQQQYTQPSYYTNPIWGQTIPHITTVTTEGEK